MALLKLWVMTHYVGLGSNFGVSGKDDSEKRER